MARPEKPAEPTEANELNQPPPDTNDPGDARRKGFGPEPGRAKRVPPDGPLPVADDVADHVRKPRQPGATGRSDSQDYTPNDRARGSDG